jgi:DNA polymerase-3 subunit alpha
MAANLTNEINAQDKDKLSECISEARRMGLAIDPPDINRSDKLFTVVEGRIVYGLLGIKGLGRGPADEIVSKRKEGGPYKNLMDFLGRVDIKAVGKSVIERLIQTGAFDRLGTARETLLGNFERAVEYAQSVNDDKKFGQGSLFGDTGEKEYPDFEFETFPEAGRSEKLKTEKELIGFYFSGHPMDEYRELWQRAVRADLGHPENFIPGVQILVGLLKNIRPVTTSRGDRMAFATLEDYNGEIELAFFKDVWQKCQGKAEADRVVILRGKIDYQQSRDKHSFTVDEYLEPDEAEKSIKEGEAQARKWDRYRNIRKYAKALDLNLLDLGSPANAEPGTYTVFGILKSYRTHVDKKGKEMAFGTLQDERGEIDLVFFARTWENCKALAAVDEMLALKGTVDTAADTKQGRISFVVSSMQDVNRLVRLAAKKAAEDNSQTSTEVSPEETGPAVAQDEEPVTYREIHVRLVPDAAHNEPVLRSLKVCLEEHPGSCPVYIHVPVSSEEKVIRTAEQINAGVSASIDALSECTAVADVWGAR